MTKNSPIAELPRAIDAEESVIGCILLHGVDVYEDVQPWIKNAEVFYKEIHQELWKACTSLYKENQTIDIITVKEKLNEMKLNLINKDAHLDMVDTMRPIYLLMKNLYHLSIRIMLSPH